MIPRRGGAARTTARGGAAWILGFVLAGQLGLAPRALAQAPAPSRWPAPPSAAAPAGDEAQREAQAREHYRRGTTYFDVADYEAAIAEFKKAYELSRSRPLLFNIAQSYRLKRDYGQALFFYRRYLALWPDAPNRADVEARIVQMETRLKEEQAAQAEVRSQLLPTGSAAAEEAGNERPLGDKPRRQARRLKLSGLITAAAGLPLLATGIYFGVHSRALARELSRSYPPAGAAGTPPPWTSSADQKARSGQTAAAVATALMAVGGAAVGAGSLLYLLGWRRERALPSLALVPGPGGAVAKVSWVH